MSDAQEIFPALTPRERTFVEHVVAGKPYNRAAIAAGYAKKSARDQGMQMARRPHVRAAIDRLARAKAEEAGLTAGRVLHELALLAKSDLGWFDCDPATGKLRVTEDAPQGATRALAKIKRTITHRTVGKGDDAEQVTTITAEFALWNKPEALIKAGQHTGAFDDERLGVEELRDLLAAIATITLRTIEAALPASQAAPILSQLEVHWHALVSGRHPQITDAQDADGRGAVDAGRQLSRGA